MLTLGDLPRENVFEVDLDAMKWCNNDKCGTIRDQNPKTITFSNYKEFPTDGYWDTVNRETGQFNSLTDLGSVDGQCTLAPFSGFPKVKF